MAKTNEPPWPGFVDALSTVLMVMIFFTLLMVLVVGTLSYMISLKDVSPDAEPSEAETAQGVKSLDTPDKPTSMQTLSQVLNIAVELEEEDLAKEPVQPELTVERLQLEKVVLQTKLNKAYVAIKDLEEKDKGNSDSEEKLRKAFARIEELENAMQQGTDTKLVDTKELKVNKFTTKFVKGLSSNNRVIILYNQLNSNLEDGTKEEFLAWVKSNKADILASGMTFTASLRMDGVPSTTANNVSYKRLYDLIRIVNRDLGIPKAKIEFSAPNNAILGTNQVTVSLQSTKKK